MELTYMDQDLMTWLLMYLRGRGTRFQDLPGLPNKLKRIAKEQDDIGWVRFTEGRVGKQIRNMQAAYMFNGDQTYTVDHWMRDLIKRLLHLSHEQWLARNLMKHHQTKGSIALETREQLGRELDKLLDKDIHNIQDQDRWLLDLQQSDVGEMSLRQLQYSVFTLRAANTLDNVVIQRTGGKTKDFAAHVKMEGIEVPTANKFNSDGSFQEEKAAEAKACKNKEKDSKDRATKAKTENQTPARGNPTLPRREGGGS